MAQMQRKHIINVGRKLCNIVGLPRVSQGDKEQTWRGGQKWHNDSWTLAHKGHLRPIQLNYDNRRDNKRECIKGAIGGSKVNTNGCR